MVSLCVFCICVCHCISHLFPKMNQNPRRSYRKLTGWRSLWLKHTMCSNDTSRCHSCRFRQPLEQWACRLLVFFTRQRYVLPHGANVGLSVTWFYILTFNFIFCTIRAPQSHQLHTSRAWQSLITGCRRLSWSLNSRLYLPLQPPCGQYFFIGLEFGWDFRSHHFSDCKHLFSDYWDFPFWLVF